MKAIADKLACSTLDSDEPEGFRLSSRHVSMTKKPGFLLAIDHGINRANDFILLKCYFAHKIPGKTFFQNTVYNVHFCLFDYI